ncbi:MAG TPA: DUF4398 domain-containing protein [Thiobacillaceae bacterium]|nr:DUF4398 domain-containing protein [Thiobacillaceae bacterium]
MNGTKSLKSNPVAQRIGLAAIGVLLMAGCASAPAPTDQMAVSRAAVSSAMSAGGNQFAPVQTRSALEKMEAAERAMASKDYEEARRLAEQAEVDAKLATEMAHSAKAKRAAEAVQEDTRILREELERRAK